MGPSTGPPNLRPWELLRSPASGGNDRRSKLDLPGGQAITIAGAAGALGDSDGSSEGGASGCLRSQCARVRHTLVTCFTKCVACAPPQHVALKTGLSRKRDFSNEGRTNDITSRVRSVARAARRGGVPKLQTCPPSPRNDDHRRDRWGLRTRLKMTSDKCSWAAPCPCQNLACPRLKCGDFRCYARAPRQMATLR